MDLLYADIPSLVIIIANIVVLVIHGRMAREEGVNFMRTFYIINFILSG